jgi:hypothetical protein
VKLLNRLVGKAMGTFVAQGVSIDDAGRLCLPDGLTPDRVKRFIELCVGRSYANPRDAMHDLFGRVGVDAKAVAMLNDVVHEDGDLDMSAVAHHWRSMAGALGSFHEIPGRFRDFLVNDLGLADPSSRNLEAAVVSARRNAATHLGCAPEWDRILELPDGIATLSADWRAGLEDPA